MDLAGHVELNRVQLEGYLEAFFSQVANRCDNKLTQQCLLKQFEQYSFQDNKLSINLARTTIKAFNKFTFTLLKQ